jgi:hypothetical protein
MFHTLGWAYEYEPIDLKGYIPDFILSFHKPLLVEIKPAFSFDEYIAASTKILESGWDHESLILGGQLNFPTMPSIGLIGSREWTPEIDFDHAEIFPCPKCGPSICCWAGPRECRICGLVSDWSNADHLSLLLNRIWNECGEAVRYTRPIK